MKQSVIILLLFVTWSCSDTSHTDNASIEKTEIKSSGHSRVSDEKEKTMDISTKAQSTTMLIVSLVKSANKDSLSEHIRTPDISGIKRHAASVQTLTTLFSGIELRQIKMGRADYFPEKNIIVVRMEEPRKIDLEYYIDPKENKLLLQSIHP